MKTIFNKLPVYFILLVSAMLVWSCDNSMEDGLVTSNGTPSQPNGFLDNVKKITENSLNYLVTN